MKYDFNVIPDRSNCGSSKWNGAPGSSVNQVPLSTADMEFPPAPEIVNALKNLLDTTVLGYTSPTKEYFDAVTGWMKRRHNYDVLPEEIVTTPGVVFALAALVEATTKPGDNVIILSPVYYPFDLAVIAKGRHIVYSPLKLENGRYDIDFDDLAEKAACEKNTALLFCNPHNPIGRVWTADELKRVVDICADNGVFIIDDEIHHDLIMPGYKHTAMPTVSDRAKDICAVCTAPSKTFNLAGIQCSNIIIPNAKIRAAVSAVKLSNILLSLNIFAYTACAAAYNECEDWLAQLIDVVQENANYITDFLGKHFPEVKVFPLEGTYLLWADFSGLGMTHPELEKLMKEDAGLYLDEGYIFGKEGRGYERFNLACAPETIHRSMDRLKIAIDNKRADWEKNGKPYHKVLAVGDKLEGFVYDTADKSNVDLATTIEKPTILIFSRYFTCGICQTLLSQLKAGYPALEAAGVDIKVVLQSTAESLKEGASNFPFDLIADPDCKLYDRYNVFEADTMANMITGDKMFENLSADELKGFFLSSMGGGKPEGRQRQLSAVVAVNPNMDIKYAYYSKTLTDFPEIPEIVSSLTK